jgi:hypothetical protein
MQVPPEWRIAREGGGLIVMLQGPTPHSEASIQLKERDAIPTSEFENLMAGIRREQASGSGEGSVSIRSQGPVQFVERQSFMRPMNLPVTDPTGVQLVDEKGEPRMQRTTPMRWRVNVFVPRAETYDYFELNFINLSKEQYEIDRQFLQHMLATLQYVGPLPAGDDGAATTAPAAATTQGTNR